ncbi:uncharacterized protein PAC_16277 [Phialocephala subalpina]|uniref:Uncharacterized protein n=1 Tax=Phialocephala subalpina TaxID=576137 RepID=A0A1L7XN69_9HELO|nr:uncharacterized protein PAC_16277 [Phialocephala subalpina]
MGEKIDLLPAKKDVDLLLPKVDFEAVEFTKKFENLDESLKALPTDTDLETLAGQINNLPTVNRYSDQLGHSRPTSADENRDLNAKVARVEGQLRSGELSPVDEHRAWGRGLGVRPGLMELVSRPGSSVNGGSSGGVSGAGSANIPGFGDDSDSGSSGVGSESGSGTSGPMSLLPLVIRVLGLGSKNVPAAEGHSGLGDRLNFRNPSPQRRLTRWQAVAVGPQPASKGRMHDLLLNSDIPTSIRALLHNKDRESKSHRAVNAELNEGRPRICWMSQYNAFNDWPELANDTRTTGMQSAAKKAERMAWWEEKGRYGVKVPPVLVSRTEGWGGCRLLLLQRQEEREDVCLVAGLRLPLLSSQSQ